MAILFTSVFAYFIGAFPIQAWLYRKGFRRIPSPWTVIAIDVIKGSVATLIGLGVAGWVGASLSAIFVVVGSMYSVFLRFHGGNGLSVSAGALLVLSPILLLIGLAIYGLSLLLTRMWFLSTLLTVIALLILGVMLASQLYVWMVLLFLGTLIVLQQRVEYKQGRAGFIPTQKFRFPFRK